MWQHMKESKKKQKEERTNESLINSVQQSQEQTNEQNNSSSNYEATTIFYNFIFMGVLFSAVHATSVSCLELVSLSNKFEFLSRTIYH